MPRKNCPPNDKLLEALRHMCCTEGVVTRFEFCERMGISRSLIDHRFGGWNKMRELAELPAASPGKHHWFYTDEQILQALRSMVERDGPGVTLSEFSRHTGISQTAVRTHFGTWKNLRAAVGLEPLKTRNEVYSDAEILDDVDGLCRKLGRFPGAMDLERHGRFAPATYYRRFGPFRELRKALNKHRIVRELWKRKHRIATQGFGTSAADEMRAQERPMLDPYPFLSPAWGPDGEWIVPPVLFDDAKRQAEL